MSQLLPSHILMFCVKKHQMWLRKASLYKLSPTGNAYMCQPCDDYKTMSIPQVGQITYVQDSNKL